MNAGMFETTGDNSEGVLAQVGESGDIPDFTQIDNGNATITFNGGSVITRGDGQFWYYRNNRCEWNR